MGFRKVLVGVILMTCCLLLNSQSVEKYNDYVLVNKPTDKAANGVINDFRNLKGSIKKMSVYRLDGSEKSYQGGYLGSVGYNFAENKKILEKRFYYEEDVPVLKMVYHDFQADKMSEKVILNKDGSELYKRAFHYDEEGYLKGFNNYSEGKKKDKGKFKAKSDEDSTVVRVESMALKYFNNQPLSITYHVLSTKMISSKVIYNYYESGAVKSITQSKREKIILQEQYNENGQLTQQFFDLDFANRNVDQRINDFYVSKLTKHLGEANLDGIVDVGPTGYRQNQFVQIKDLYLELPELGKITIGYTYNEHGLLSEQMYSLEDSSSPTHKVVFHYQDHSLDHYEYYKGEVQIWNRIVSYNDKGDLTSIINVASNAPTIKIAYLEYDDQNNWIKKREVDDRGNVSIYLRRIEYYN